MDQYTITIKVDPTCLYPMCRDCIHDVVVVCVKPERRTEYKQQWGGKSLVSIFKYYKLPMPAGTCRGKVQEKATRPATRPAPSAKYPEEYWETKGPE
jgi:hypothetical protein